MASPADILSAFCAAVLVLVWGWGTFRNGLFSRRDMMLKMSRSPQQQKRVAAAAFSRWLQNIHDAECRAIVEAEATARVQIRTIRSSTAKWKAHVLQQASAHVLMAMASASLRERCQRRALVVWHDMTSGEIKQTRIVDQRARVTLYRRKACTFLAWRAKAEAEYVYLQCHGYAAVHFLHHQLSRAFSCWAERAPMILAGSMRMKIIGRPFQTWLHFAWAEAALEEQGLLANSRLKRRMRAAFFAAWTMASRRYASRHQRANTVASASKRYALSRCVTRWRHNANMKSIRIEERWSLRRLTSKAVATVHRSRKQAGFQVWCERTSTAAWLRLRTRAFHQPYHRSLHAWRVAAAVQMTLQHKACRVALSVLHGKLHSAVLRWRSVKQMPAIPVCIEGSMHVLERKRLQAVINAWRAHAKEGKWFYETTVLVNASTPSPVAKVSAPLAATPSSTGSFARRSSSRKAWMVDLSRANALGTSDASSAAAASAAAKDSKELEDSSSQQQELQIWSLKQPLKRTLHRWHRLAMICSENRAIMEESAHLADLANLCRRLRRGFRRWLANALALLLARPFADSCDRAARYWVAHHLAGAWVAWVVYASDWRAFASAVDCIPKFLAYHNLYHGLLSWRAFYLKELATKVAHQISVANHLRMNLSLSWTTWLSHADSRRRAFQMSKLSVFMKQERRLSMSFALWVLAAFRMRLKISEMRRHNLEALHSHHYAWQLYARTIRDPASHVASVPSPSYSDGHSTPSSLASTNLELSPPRQQHTTSASTPCSQSTPKTTMATEPQLQQERPSRMLLPGSQDSAMTGAKYSHVPSRTHRPSPPNFAMSDRATSPKTRRQARLTAYGIQLRRRAESIGARGWAASLR